VLLWMRGVPRGVRITALVSGAAFAIGVGVSRVYFGVHYPSDVLAPGWRLRLGERRHRMDVPALLPGRTPSVRPVRLPRPNPHRRRLASAYPSGPMKPCPFCAEEIQDAAIKCRHCGSMLAETAAAAVASQPPRPQRGGAGRRDHLQRRALLEGAVLVVVTAIALAWWAVWRPDSPPVFRHRLELGADCRGGGPGLEGVAALPVGARATLTSSSRRARSTSSRACFRRTSRPAALEGARHRVPPDHDRPAARSVPHPGIQP